MVVNAIRPLGVVLILSTNGSSMQTQHSGRRNVPTAGCANCFNWKDMSYRHFFALRPEPHAIDAATRLAASLKAQLSLGGNSVNRNRLHVIWAFIGRYDEPREDVEVRAIAAGDAVRCQCFEIAFDYAASFGRGMGNAPCVFVASKIPQEFSRTGSILRMTLEDEGAAGPDAYPFRPHVTWLYSPDRIRGDHRIEPLIWKASEIHLLQSTSGVPAHRTIRTWSLQNP
jgi:2'-5' RNA ligase